MYCTKCGNKNDENDTFCIECGDTLKMDSKDTSSFEQKLSKHLASKRQKLPRSVPETSIVRSRNIFLKMLIVKRDEIQDKWWHRLVNVLIYVSTGVVIVIAATTLFPDKFFWEKYSYTTFSFEPNYSESNGRSIYCEYHDYPDNYFMCGDHSLPDIIKRFNKVMRDKYGAGIECTKLKQETVGTSAWEWQSVMCEAENSDVYPVHIQGHENETKDFYGNTSVKAIRIIDWGILLNYAGVVSSIALAWFIFWESIVYRILLYIVYGRVRK